MDNIDSNYYYKYLKYKAKYYELKHGGNPLLLAKNVMKNKGAITKGLNIVKNNPGLVNSAMNTASSSGLLGKFTNTSATNVSTRSNSLSSSRKSEDVKLEERICNNNLTKKCNADPIGTLKKYEALKFSNGKKAFDRIRSEANEKSCNSFPDMCRKKQINTCKEYVLSNCYNQTLRNKVNQIN